MKKLISIFVISVFTVNSYSQESDTTKTINISDVEVVGVRASSNTPVTQKKVTRDEITKSYQGQEMTYILSNTPSVNFSSDGGHAQGYTYFRMRGIDQTRINMTLNGVPLNEPEDQGVYFSNYPMFALNIESMQIQRGVGTSSNGTSSYGGSINFESVKGLIKSTNIEAGYGSFNTGRLNVNHSTGKSKKGFAAFGSLSAYTSDGYKYNSGGNGYSGFISAGYYGNKDVVKFTAFSGMSYNEMAWLAVSETDIKNDPRTNYNPEGETDLFRQHFAQLQYTRQLSNRSSLTTTAYYNRLTGNWGMFMDSVNLMEFGLSSHFMGFVSNYQLKTKKYELNVGVNANDYQRTHSMVIDNFGKDPLYVNTGYKNDFGGYSKFTYKINKLNLFADAQLRYVDFKYKGDVSMEDLNWLFFNPKAGVSFKQNNKLTHYFTVGQSHREPTRTDMFGGWDNLVSLNIINPEQVIDYELGSYLTLKNLSVQANLFYMDFKNEITLLGALGFNGLPLMTNVTKSFRSGIELDVNYKLGKYFFLLNNSSFMNCKIVNNNTVSRPLYTPNVIVNQSVNFEHKGFMASVSARYQSKSFIDFENTATAPEFVVLNCAVSYKLSKYTLLVNLNNITNKQYFTNGYVFGGERYFFVNAPFNFGATLKANI